MKKTITFLLLAFSSALFAQQKMMTMQDAMLNARTTLAPENLRQLQFIKGTDDYIYLKKGNPGEWVRGNFSTKEEKTYLTLLQINMLLKKWGMDTLNTMPAIVFSKESFSYSVKGIKYDFNSSNNSSIIDSSRLSAKDHYEISKNEYAAYLQNNNLFVSKNGNTKQVTTDGSENIVYASSVHRDEFGINKGTFWSNNGNILAFYRMDQSMVTDYPIINWTTNPATNENIKYPMAGNKSHEVTVGIYDAVANKTIWLKTENGNFIEPASSFTILNNPKERYLTNIAWSPDDKYIFIAVVNRAQNHMWLNKYDANTGEYVSTLFEDTNDKYIEPLVPMLFVKNNPNQFIWQSKRDGWNHLYLYDFSGKLISQLTTGKWEVVEVKGFDEKGENLFYISTAESPITKNLYQINIKTKLSKRLTQASGIHNITLSSNGNYFIDNYSNSTTPKIIQITNVKTGKSKQLIQSTNPLAAYALGQLNIFTISNNDGTDLYCRMYKPVGFDSTKQYPVIVYWYGGPHAQMILNGWNGGAGDYWFQYMAERGYIVFTIDTRGSMNRGREFEQSIFRKAGEMQMEDLMAGIKYLHAKPFVDKTKMGLFGWSYGGFMTTNFLLNHPGIFKAGVAGGPVIDWSLYEIMYGERYMDTPQENPEGYSKTNLTKQVAKLKDKLLLIHGLQDPVVVQQHSVAFVKAAVDAGIQVDYMIYPGHEHNVLGKDRVHLYQKVTDYFEQYLK